MMKPYDTGCLLLSTYLGYIPHIPPVQWPTLRHPSISGERDSKRNSQRGPICWKNGRRRCVPGGFSFRSFPSFFWGQTSERSVEDYTRFGSGLDEDKQGKHVSSLSPNSEDPMINTSHLRVPRTARCPEWKL